jgi:hypothetical protein
MEERRMDLGPHADDVLDIVELVESGVIFRDPRPPLDSGLILINDMAEASNYGFTEANSRDGRYWEWRELLAFAGEPYSREEIDKNHYAVLRSVPGLTDRLVDLMEYRIGPSLEMQLRPKHKEDTVLYMYGTFDFIMSHRATSGRALPFIERLVEIYRLGGHPCGWAGPYPEGQLVACFPPKDDALEHAPRTGRA